VDASALVAPLMVYFTTQTTGEITIAGPAPNQMRITNNALPMASNQDEWVVGVYLTNLGFTDLLPRSKYTSE
jgi:hypothetical protein